MEKYIAEVHIVTGNGVVKPGNEVEIKKDHVERMKAKGWISDIPNDGQPGQDDLDITNIGKMTHDQLDAVAGQLEIPDGEYPKSGNKDEKVASIEEFTEKNGLVE